MNGKQLPACTPTMRYLGYQISDDLKEHQHLYKRNVAAQTAYYRLEAMGLNNRTLKWEMKAYLHKTIYRPIILYGIENTIVNTSNLQQLKSMEGNLLKKSLKVITKTRTTPLQASFFGNISTSSICYKNKNQILSAIIKERIHEEHYYGVAGNIKQL